MILCAHVARALVWAGNPNVACSLARWLTREPVSRHGLWQATRRPVNQPCPSPWPSRPSPLQRSLRPVPHRSRVRSAATRPWPSAPGPAPAPTGRTPGGTVTEQGP